MTNPVQSFRWQGRAHRRKGITTVTGAPNAGGAYTAEAFAFVDATTGADRTVVAAQSGSKIRVLSYSCSGPAGGVSTTTFKSATAGAISQLISLPANGFAHESDNNGLFETASGEALVVTTSATVGVRVTYILVD